MEIEGFGTECDLSLLNTDGNDFGDIQIHGKLSLSNVTFAAEHIILYVEEGGSLDLSSVI